MLQPFAHVCGLALNLLQQVCFFFFYLTVHFKLLKNGCVMLFKSQLPHDYDVPNVMESSVAIAVGGLFGTLGCVL